MQVAIISEYDTTSMTESLLGRLQKLIELNAHINIGCDVPMDCEVQNFLADVGYENVTVYYVPTRDAFHNAGNWSEVQIMLTEEEPIEDPAILAQFYGADYGLHIAAAKTTTSFNRPTSYERFGVKTALEYV